METPSIFDLMSAKDTTVTNAEGEKITLPEAPKEYSPDMIRELDAFMLSGLVADSIFGDKLDNKDEHVFLSSMLDETEPLQAEYISKLSAIFERQSYAPPDRWSIQIFRRKAGFKASRNDTDFGNYSMALCMKDHQIVVYNGQEYPLVMGQTSPCFELKPQPTDKKEKPSPRPSVPRNRVQYTKPNGQKSLKTRNYWCILVWAFWDEMPLNRNREPSKEGLQKAMQAAAEQLEAKQSSEDATEETVLYDATQ